MHSLRAFFLFALFFRIGSCALSEFQPDREIDIMAESVKQIIKRCYRNRASAISLVRLAKQPLTYYKQSEIINRVLLSTKSKISYVVEEPAFMKQSPFLRFNAIIFLDGYDAFR